MKTELQDRNSLAIRVLSWLYVHYSWHKASLSTSAVYIAAPVGFSLFFLVVAIVCFVDYGLGPFIPRPLPDSLYWAVILGMVVFFACVEWYVRSRIETIVQVAQDNQPPAWFRHWSFLWVWGMTMISFAVMLAAAFIAGRK